MVLNSIRLKNNFNVWTRLGEFVLDALFPKHCIACGKFGRFVCADCAGQLDLKIRRARVKRGKVNLPLIYFANYNTPGIKSIIHHAKFGGLKDIWRDLELEKLGLELPRAGALVPVPLSARRRRERGYNQTLELAKALLGQNKAEIVELLARVRHTRAQATLEKNQKRVNVKNAFVINSNLKIQISKLKKKTIYLIDDVATTGATLAESSRCLARAGFKNIQAIVFAKG